MSVAEEEIVEKEPTLRETIEAARDEALNRQKEPEGDKHDAEPARVPDTRSAEPRAPAATREGGTDQPAAAPGESPTGSVSPTVEPPPQGWTAPGKALWTQLPAEVRSEITRREADFHRTITQHDEVRRLGNEFMRTANEYAPIIQARGGNPVALFREFMGILHTLSTADPQTRAQLIRDVALRQGADMNALAQPAQADSSQSPPVPPQVLQMSQEWNAFKRQQLESQQRQSEEARQREDAEMQQTAAEIEAFRSKAENVHFDAVKDLMASILRGGVASTLEEAYNLAVKAHPETSKALEQQAQAAAKAEEEKRRKAESARRKAGSVRGGPGSVPEVSGSKGSVRDDLRAAFDEVRSRV